MVEESELVRQFLQHRDAILAFIFALTGNHEVAEEVFQEVGLAITQEARQGRQVDNFRAWAREIARRRVAAYYRVHGKHKAMLPLSDALAEVIEQGFRENELVQEQAQTRFKFLHQCLELLVGRSKQVIEQKYRHGKSIADIADALSWKPESVKVALSRARKQLADCVQNKMRLHEMA
jgi:RNA polymerase sigma-70 factor (ECF subfamily)